MMGLMFTDAGGQQKEAEDNWKMASLLECFGPLIHLKDCSSVAQHVF